VVQSIDNGEVNGGIDCLMDANNDSPRGCGPQKFARPPVGSRVTSRNV
jgi:hypothetical protein